MFSEQNKKDKEQAIGYRVWWFMDDKKQPVRKQRSDLFWNLLIFSVYLILAILIVLLGFWLYRKLGVIFHF